MKFTAFTFILASTMLTSTAVMAAQGMAKHDASIAQYSYSVPIIDSGAIGQAGASLKDDLNKGYKPVPRQMPSASTSSPFQHAPAPRKAAAPAAQQTAQSQGGGSFSDVANGVAPTPSTNEALSPAATNGGTQANPAARSAAGAGAGVTPPSSIVPADGTSGSNPTATQNDPTGATLAPNGLNAPTNSVSRNSGSTPSVPADAALPSAVSSTNANGSASTTPSTGSTGGAASSSSSNPGDATNTGSAPGGSNAASNGVTMSGSGSSSSSTGGSTSGGLGGGASAGAGGGK